MTANDIYKLPPIDTTRKLYGVQDHFQDADTSDIPDGANTRVTVRTYADHCFDGERTWVLRSVWLDDRPFLIAQNAGRGGRDHSDTFVTDAASFTEAVAYLRSLCPTQMIASHDPDAENNALTSFYGCQLADFYVTGLTPKYAVGDVVIARVPKDHLRDRRTTVETRVRIESVRPHSPRETYHGKQLDRRWNGPLGHEMVEDRDNGGVWATFCDADVVGHAHG